MRTIAIGPERAPSATGLMSLGEFLRRLVNCPDAPPRTVVLEQQIHIGTGFHGKWYRSQREHWLGSLGYVIAKHAAAGVEASDMPAKPQWTRTHCFPMLFWVAESAGVDDETLHRAEAAAYEAAALIGRDHPSHGRAARSVLPWTLVEHALREHVPLSSRAVTQQAVSDAYHHLAGKLPRFRLPGAT